MIPACGSLTDLSWTADKCHLPVICRMLNRQSIIDAFFAIMPDHYRQYRNMVMTILRRIEFWSTRRPGENEIRPPDWTRLELI